MSPRPFGELDFNGKTERLKNGTTVDTYLQDREGLIKVGVRENWGSTLIFFGQGERNTLDGSKPDRGVQVTLRDDARETQGCAYDESCKTTKSACLPANDFIGWQASQSGNKCGDSVAIDALLTGHGLATTFQPALWNPAWRSKGCQDGCHDPGLRKQKSEMRITQFLRFIKSGVLEVEYLITNLDNSTRGANLGKLHELPRLFASTGNDGNSALNVLKNAREERPLRKRSPANREKLLNYLSDQAGWASYQNQQGDYGVGIYWENRNDKIKGTQIPNQENSLRSNFPFALPASDSIRARFYLLLGGFTQVKGLAEELDQTLAPFGRIETNEIQPDTRSVVLKGWALDNKAVKTLELLVDGQKVADLAFNSVREDICTAYPGYAMCEPGRMKVGFEATYPRPNGQGCDRTVEVRATDFDGNIRIIARKGISPVLY